MKKKLKPQFLIVSILLCSIITVTACNNKDTETTSVTTETVAETSATETTQQNNLIPTQPDEQMYNEDIAPKDIDAINILQSLPLIFEYMTQGKGMMGLGENIYINNENCAVVAVGTNSENGFVAENKYAVSPSGAAYSLNAAQNTWDAINSFAEIYNKGYEENVLFAVLTDSSSTNYTMLQNNKNIITVPSSQTNDKIILVPIKNNINLRIEKIEYDEASEQFKTTEVCENISNVARGETYEIELPIGEAIPQVRIVAECGDITSEWYAANDNKGTEDNTDFILSR